MNGIILMSTEILYVGNSYCVYILFQKKMRDPKLFVVIRFQGGQLVVTRIRKCNEI